MDLSTIDDITQLKALAFDEITKADQARANLQVVQTRIAELQNGVRPPLEPASTPEIKPAIAESSNEGDILAT